VVVEESSALAVDDRGCVIGAGWGDDREFGAAWEPPAPLAVEVLDLAALPWRVRVAERNVHVEAVGEPGDHRVGVLALGLTFPPKPVEHPREHHENPVERSGNDEGPGH
jgi:hypothetical protein